MTDQPEHTFTLEPTDPRAAPVRELVRDYFREILTRFDGRAPMPAELDAVLADDPDLSMAPPSGIFLLARSASSYVACAGLRMLTARTAELKRVYVQPSVRGHGLGTTLVAALETHAASLGAISLRLDTRHELDEARRLYERRGYREIPRYSGSPLADVWLEKKLDPS